MTTFAQFEWTDALSGLLPYLMVVLLCMIVTAPLVWYITCIRPAQRDHLLGRFSKEARIQYLHVYHALDPVARCDNGDQNKPDIKAKMDSSWKTYWWLYLILFFGG